MREGGYMEPENTMGTVGDLLHHRGRRNLVSVKPNARVTEVIGVMKMHGVSQVPVLEEGKITGVLFEKRLLEKALEANRSDVPVSDLVEATYCTVDRVTEVAVLTELFRRFKVAVVLDDQHAPVDIITRIDLIDYISSIRPAGGGA
jgi:cystathionine beta-synthase